MKKLKKSWVEVLCFMMGVILGCAAYIYSEYFIAPSNEEAVGLVDDQRMAEWGKIASQALAEEDPSIAIWAMDNLVQLKESRFAALKEGDINKPMHRRDLVLTYGRRAVVAKAVGDEQKYTDSLVRAVGYIRDEATWQKYKSTSGLMTLIHQITEFGPKILNKLEAAQK